MALDKLKAIINHISIFDRSTLSGRIRFQKSIYLIQKLGLDLGYEYVLYHYGPYSSKLANHMYELDPRNLKTSLNLSQSELNILNKFRSLIKDNENNTTWFEMAATMIYLNKTLSNREELLKELIKRHNYFEDNELLKIVQIKLEEFRLLN